MRILHCYRPRVPLMRAQFIQSLHTAHALAQRGHEVSVFAERAADWHGDIGAALASYGLKPHAQLDLRLARSTHPGVTGLRFRRLLAQWLVGQNGVVYARSKKWARFAMRFGALSSARLVLEVHEVDSAQRVERGEDAREMLALERQVLGAASGVVANCEGTLEQLRQVHGALVPPACVVHNGTSPDRQIEPVPHDGVVVGYLGSPRRYKDLDTVLAAAGELNGALQFRVIGAPADDAAGLNVQGTAHVEVADAVPYPEVAPLLAGLDVAVLPLGTDLYSRELASPLKLWDYLAAGLRVVAADTPSVRRICGEDVEYYQPGDASSLISALQRALLTDRPAPRLRTWADRAAEIETFLESVL